MVTTVLTDGFRSTPRPDPLHVLRLAWQAHRRQRADRLALARAGRLGPRLLADMGLDPEAAGAVPEGWETLRPNGYLVHRRR